MLPGFIDILMVTHNRLEYTQRSLPRLLETCDDRMRVWVWHNGDPSGKDAPTLELVKSMQSHPRFHRLHHSPENQRLRGPMNWFWEQSDAEYIGKIDDDNLMPDQWGQMLRGAHEAEPKLGVVACWSFKPEDVVPELVERKLKTLGSEGAGGDGSGGKGSNGAAHRIMLNPWIAGTGQVMKRECYLRHGSMHDKQSFPNYTVKLALAGWIHGWYYPLIYMENMDDPRSAYTRLTSESEFQKYRSLSDARFGIETLERCLAHQRTLALEVQAASPDARQLVGWRRQLGKVKKVLSGNRRPKPRWS